MNEYLNETGVVIKIYAIVITVNVKVTAEVTKAL